MSSPEVKIILSLIDQTKEGLAQAGLNVKSYGDTVEQEAKKIEVSWKDVATSVSGVVTAGFALYSMYENIQRQQLMVMRLTNSLEDAQRRQNNALEKLNKAIADHGANSEEAARAQEAYEAACGDVLVTQERLSYTQNNLDEAMLRAALFTIPSVITAVDRGTVAYKELSKAVDAVAAGQASLATTTVAAAGIIGIAAVAVGVMYIAFEKLAEYIYDVSDAEEKLQEETLRTAELFEGLDVGLKAIEDTLPEVEKQVDELAEIFITGADKIKKSYFDVFTKESQEFQDDVRVTASLVYDFLSEMEPNFAAVSVIVQNFADQWGITWDEASSILMEKVEEIKATIGTVAPTLEEELVGKAQAAMERFKECMGEKSTATRDEMTSAMEDMVSSINELISYGLLGEAQALMDTFKEAEPDKMWTMVQDIDAAIESLTKEMETEFEEMLAIADTLSGEERDLMIQRAEELKEGYLAKIEELENMRSIILTRMQLETQGYSDEEINIIMSGLTTLQALSGAKWDEITRIWQQCLDDAEGDVAAAIAAMQGYINSLQGKDVYVNTYYTSIYRTVYEAAGAAAPESGTATISATAGTVGCFLSRTKISMLDGSKKSIENLNVGDLVKSWDSEKGVVNGTVTRTFRGKTEAYLIINGKLRVTPSHPFYVNGNLVKAGNLKIGEYLQSENNGYIRVKEIHLIAESRPVYNFEVDGEHNYFAEGVLVHNKPWTLTPEGILVLTQPEAALWRAGFARRIMEAVPKTTQGVRGERNISIGPIYVGSIASDMDIRETACKLARYTVEEERRIGLD